MYIPMRQTGDYAAMELVVRTALPPDNLASTIRLALRPIDPNLPVNRFQALQVKKYPEKVGISRFGKPEEIAELMAFLVSPAAKWMTGSAVRMDGGEIKSV